MVWVYERLSPCHFLKAHGKVEVYIYALTSALDGGVCSASRSGRFTVRESAPFTHWTEVLLGCAAGLDTGDDKDLLGLPGIQFLFPGRPACSLVNIPTELCHGVGQGWRTFLRARAQTVLTFRRNYFGVPMGIFKSKIGSWSIS